MVSFPTAFQASLFPASYNGIPFFVVDTSIKTGQRVAAHEFPMRSTPYNEPLGKAIRNFSFTAFLVGSAFGERQPEISTPFDLLPQNVFSRLPLRTQYFMLMAEIEGKAVGTLVHPMFGQQSVICTQAETTMNTGNGYIELRLNFVEAGQVIFPSTNLDTQSDTIRIQEQAQNNVQQHYDDWWSTDNSTAPANASDANPAAGSGTPAQNSMNDLGDRAVSSPSSNFGVA